MNCSCDSLPSGDVFIKSHIHDIDIPVGYTVWLYVEPVLVFCQWVKFYQQYTTLSVDIDGVG